MSVEKNALVLCDIKPGNKRVKSIGSFVKKFVTEKNSALLIVYAGNEEVVKYVTEEFKGFEVPLSIIDQYEWGESPSFVLIVTDDEKSPLESVARHHFYDKTYAIVTMVIPNVDTSK